MPQVSLLRKMPRYGPGLVFPKPPRPLQTSRTGLSPASANWSAYEALWARQDTGLQSRSPRRLAPTQALFPPTSFPKRKSTNTRGPRSQRFGMRAFNILVSAFTGPLITLHGFVMRITRLDYCTSQGNWGGS